MIELLRHLSATIAAHLAQLEAGSPDITVALQHLRVAAQGAMPRGHMEVSRSYDGLVSRAARGGVDGVAGEIAATLLAARSALPWVYHYSPRSVGDDLSDRIAFAELIGPDGPMAAPAARVGFTVVAEQTLYPFHTHPAVELYLVISGHARWTTPTSDRIVPPGELVLHRSNEPHAMQTFDQPLLALWGWSGDLDSPAVYTPESFGMKVS